MRPPHSDPAPHRSSGNLPIGATVLACRKWRITDRRRWYPHPQATLENRFFRHAASSCLSRQPVDNQRPDEGRLADAGRNRCHRLWQRQNETLRAPSPTLKATNRQQAGGQPVSALARLPASGDKLRQEQVSDPEIRVRGTNSINGYKPLYVIGRTVQRQHQLPESAGHRIMEILQRPVVARHLRCARVPTA